MRKLFSLTCVLTSFTLLVGACGVQNAPQSQPQTLAEEPQEIVQLIPEIGDGRQAAVTYVAEIAGSEVLAAIVVQGDRAAVYLCDGDQVGEWIGAKLGRGGQIDVTSDQDNRLEGVVLNESVKGTVELGDGQSRPFTAERAKDGESGLFRETEITEEGLTLLTGWIVLDSGRVAGVSSDTLTGATAEGVRVRVVSTDLLQVETLVEPPSDAEPRILGLGRCGKLKRLFKKLTNLAGATDNDVLAQELLEAAFEVEFESITSGCGAIP